MNKKIGVKGQTINIEKIADNSRTSMQLLKDKIALVTGGTAGIGREIALAFAKQGAHVAISGTNAERAAEVRAASRAQSNIS